MDRNVVTALIGTGLPRVMADAGASEWRESRFPTGRDRRSFAVSRSRPGTQRGDGKPGIDRSPVSLALWRCEYEVMPNLSALARRALVFENAYAVYPESIKGLYSVLCSTFPAFDSQPEEYANLGCRSVAAVLADAGYRTAMFHSGRFGYLGMESVIGHRGYQTLEDAGDIGGQPQFELRSGRARHGGADAGLDRLSAARTAFFPHLPAHCRPSPLCHSGARPLRGDRRDRSIPQRPALRG